MTNKLEQDKAIIAGAPSGATHINQDYTNLIIDSNGVYALFGDKNYYAVNLAIHSDLESVRSLADIRESIADKERIAELEQYNLGLANESCEQQKRIAELEKKLDDLGAIK